MTTGYVFQKLDKEKLLRIYQLAEKHSDWKEALDQILRYTRQFFIFDNIAIYLNEVTTKRMDVLYARATGRGRAKEADVSWGETIANRVASENKIINEEPRDNPPDDRVHDPYILGLPLPVSKTLTGALVFIRFGGPPYEKGSVEFAEFLSMQITSIIRQKSLDDYEKELEAQRIYTTLQGDFISTISHEFRNPLGFIRGYTTTLLREGTNWDKNTQRDFLEIIDRETNNLGNLIDDLLDSSRLQNGNMRFDFQMLRLDSIIRDEVSRAFTNHPELIVNIEIADHLPAIIGDARRIAQVINNLIDNSLKYAPGATINIKTYPSGDTVIIEYSDTGPGIEEKYLPVVFSRFFRVPDQSNVHGSGLGLSICKQIIDSHNGEMSVSSLPGEGLTFKIMLPRKISSTSEL
jgi:signal transduction histidine kinase